MELSELNSCESFDNARKSIVKVSSWDNKEEVEKIDSLLEDLTEVQSSSFQLFSQHADSDIKNQNSVVQMRDSICASIRASIASCRTQGIVARAFIALLFIIEVFSWISLPNCQVRSLGCHRKQDLLSKKIVHIASNISCTYTRHSDRHVEPYQITMFAIPYMSCLDNDYQSNCTGDFWMLYFDRIMEVAKYDYHRSHLPVFVHIFFTVSAVIVGYLNLLMGRARSILNRRSKQVCDGLLVKNNTVLHKYVEFKKLSSELDLIDLGLDEMFLTLLKKNAPECQYLLTLALTNSIDYMTKSFGKKDKNDVAHELYRETEKVHAVLNVYKNLNPKKVWIVRPFCWVFGFITTDFVKDLICFLCLMHLRMIRAETICEVQLDTPFGLALLCDGLHSYFIETDYMPSNVEPYVFKSYSDCSGMYSKLRSYSVHDQRLLISKFMLESSYGNKNMLSNKCFPLLLKVAKELKMNKQIIDKMSHLTRKQK